MGELEQYRGMGSKIGLVIPRSNDSSVDSNMFIKYKKAYQKKQGAMVDNFTLCYTS